MRKRKYPGSVKGFRTLLMVAAVCVGTIPTASAQSEPTQNQDSYSRTIGSAAQTRNRISGKVLKNYHPTNLLKAIQLAEPALKVIDPYDSNGSDPNYVATSANIRGTKGIPRTVTNKFSLPLILVDGYEISMDRLHDFDINRVQEVSLLKDATATAIYGIRASNGVILITTTAPQTGDVSLTYRFDGQFQKADLSSYNLMNGFEKLALEKKQGMYTENTNLYNERLNYLNTHGSTNWLKLPLKTTFSHKHQVDVEGGDENIRYKAYLLASPSVQGVMKGSKRDLYAVAAQFEYFSKNLSISNDLRLDINDAKNSPYGHFNQYTQINPYYGINDSHGKALKILGEGSVNPQNSPYYEATLNSFFKQKMTRIVNSLNASWRITPELQLKGNFTFTKDFNKYDQFISPNSLTFANLKPDQSDLRGSYQIIRDNTTTYEERLVLDYTAHRGKHLFQAGLGMHAYASTIYSDNYTGVGISNDNMDFISFAKRYAFESKPGGQEYYDRMLSGIAYASYDYDGRYTLDAVYRMDKSSRLAPKARIASSWSVSGAWNIHHEKALSGNNIFDRFILSAGVGSTAGFQFEYSNVNPVYGYAIENPYLNSVENGLGLVTLNQINTYNRDLKWKKSNNFNIGLQVGIDHRILLNVQYYNTLTNNLMLEVPGAIIDGNTTKFVNGGSIRNAGLEFGFNFTLLKNAEGLNLNLLANGVINKNKLESAPESYLRNMSTKLRKGYDVESIWAYRSLGVNPQTGREELIDRNGNPTYSDENCDPVYIGSASPHIVGTFGLSGEYKQWSFGALFQYSVGGNYFNYFKQYELQCATLQANGPKDLTKKWSTPGQQATYQGFNDQVTAPLERFVETRSTLSLSSLYVSYQFNPTFAHRLYMKGLRIGLTANDLFFASSVTVPRGSIYPFTRSFTLSLQATF